MSTTTSASNDHVAVHALVAAINQHLPPRVEHAYNNQNEPNMTEIHETVRSWNDTSLTFSANACMTFIQPALAYLLATEDNFESVALTFGTPDAATRKVKMYLCTNGSVAGATRHLNSLWNLLRAVRNTAGNHQDHLRAIDAFRQSVYAYCKLKVWAILDDPLYDEYLSVHLRRFFTEILKKDSRFVVPRGGRSESTNEACLFFEEAPIALLFFLPTTQLVLSKKTGMLGFVASEFRRFIDILFRLKIYEDPGMINKDHPFVMRCTSVIQRLATEAGENPSTIQFHEFYTRFLSFDSNVVNSLVLALLPTVSFLLDYDLVIETIKPAPVKLTYNVTDDDRVRKVFERAGKIKDYESLCTKLKSGSTGEKMQAFGKVVKKSIQPHCECALLAYLINNKIDAYRYIVTSERSCLGCDIYFRAVREVAENPKQRYHLLHVSAEKKLPWAAPGLHVEGLKEAVDERMVKIASLKLEEVIQRSLE